MVNEQCILIDLWRKYLYIRMDAMGECSQETAHGADGSTERGRWERKSESGSGSRSLMRSTRSIVVTQIRALLLILVLSPFLLAQIFYFLSNSNS